MKTASIILLLFISLPVFGCHGPAPTASEYSDEEIDTSLDPVQAEYDSAETFTLEGEDSSFTVTPVASYSISAHVVGRKAYSDGWRSAVAPLDLALSWGQLATPEYDRYITWSQHDRWYFYRWGSGTPFNAAFIVQHSSNNHIIPANENVERAVRSIEEGQDVALEGFLVRVRGTYDGREYWWNSSLSRSDSGDASCEVFYVSKVKIGNEVYQ